MKKTPVILSAIVIAAACAAIVLGKVGFFTSISVVEQKLGPFALVYESFTGDYKQTGTVFEQVKKALDREGIVTSKAIGIYYDDPQRVPTAKLRSDCGSLLESQYLPKATYLVAKHFKIKVIPPRQSVVVDFPIKGPYSYMVGPMKAYPAIKKYCARKRYTLSLVYEIYDMELQKISYVVQVKEENQRN